MRGSINHKMATRPDEIQLVKDAIYFAQERRRRIIQEITIDTEAEVARLTQMLPMEHRP
jgi:hypothetical protein